MCNTRTLDLEFLPFLIQLHDCLTVDSILSYFRAIKVFKLVTTSVCVCVMCRVLAKVVEQEFLPSPVLSARAAETQYHSKHSPSRVEVTAEEAPHAANSIHSNMTTSMHPQR